MQALFTYRFDIAAGIGISAFLVGLNILISIFGEASKVPVSNSGIKNKEDR